MSSFAVWAGFWIGTSLSANLLKYLLRDVSEKMLQRYTLTNCIDKVFFKHGVKIMILLRLSPFYRLNILIQLLAALTGLTYEHFVMSGLISIVPIVIESIQGLQVSSLE